MLDELVDDLKAVHSKFVARGIYPDKSGYNLLMHILSTLLAAAAYGPTDIVLLADIVGD